MLKTVHRVGEGYGKYSLFKHTRKGHCLKQRYRLQVIVSLKYSMGKIVDCQKPTKGGVAENVFEILMY